MSLQRLNWQSFGSALLLTMSSALAAAAPPKIDHHVKLTAENSVIGNFPAQKEPILTIKSGETVKIDTGGGAGWRNPEMDPDTWLKQHKIPAKASDPPLAETIDVWANAKRYADIQRGHFIVGPIAVDGAMPGDSLEVRIHSVTPRIPYGTTGVAPGRSLRGSEDPNKPPAHVTVFDLKRNVGLFAPGVEVPLEPFMGIMGVQPKPSDGLNHVSAPPGDFGGNLDLRDLVDGSTLYLPVWVPGGRFYTGDAHAAQGDGEISGTAIETANTLVATFILHKGTGLKMPRAETPTHFIAFGLDEDLDNAMQEAVDEMVLYVNEITGWKGTTLAYALASMAIDFEITQVVDYTKGIHAKIPKALFKDLKKDYWYKP